MSVMIDEPVVEEAKESTQSWLEGIEDSLGIAKENAEEKVDEQQQTEEKPAEQPAGQPDEQQQLFDIPDDVLEKKTPEEPEQEENVIKDSASDVQKEKDARAYAELRITNKELTQNMDKITADLESANAKLAEKEKQIEEAQSLLNRVDLQNSAAFKAKYDTPRTAMMEKIKATLREFDVDESLAEKAAALGIKNRAELMKEHLPDAFSAVLPLFTQIDAVEAERHAALENHNSTLQQVINEENVQRAQKIEAAKVALFNEALESQRSNGFLALRKSATNEKWNAAVDSIINEAKGLLKTSDIKSQVNAVLLGVQAPLYKGMMETERARRMELEKEIAEIKKLTPNLSAADRDDSKSTKQSQEDMSRPLSAADMADTITKRMRSFSDSPI